MSDSINVNIPEQPIEQNSDFNGPPDEYYDSLIETEYGESTSMTQDESDGKSFIEHIDNFRLSSVEPCFLNSDEQIKKEYYDTGFPKLNDILGGGFTAGLTALGAVSSLGKSTFALQVAHNLAGKGIHVLFFSLEMKREDIAAKAISREMYKNHKSHAKSLQEIYSFDFGNSIKENEVLKTAINTLQDVDKNLIIIEPKDKMHLLFDREEYEGVKYRKKDKTDVSFTAEQIVVCVKNYIKYYRDKLAGKKPFVFIDYLQIIEPDDKTNRTDKQAVDSSLKKFKSLADEEDIPIFLINSFNRESYSDKASMRSFKDSGNIEYSADLLLGLQFQNAGEPGFDIDEEKRRDVRKVELVILKQRYGETGITIPFDFNPKYNYFEYAPIRDKDKIRWEEKNGRISVAGLVGAQRLRGPLVSSDEEKRSTSSSKGDADATVDKPIQNDTTGDVADVADIDTEKEEQKS